MAPDPQSSTESGFFHSGFFVMQHSEQQALYSSAINEQVAWQSELPDNLNQNCDSLLFNSLCVISFIFLLVIFSHTLFKLASIESMLNMHSVCSLKTLILPGLHICPCSTVGHL